jgi:hypothetical protein
LMENGGNSSFCKLRSRTLQQWDHIPAINNAELKYVKLKMQLYLDLDNLQWGYSGCWCWKVIPKAVQLWAELWALIDMVAENRRASLHGGVSILNLLQ